jgi:hypothetical protein
MNKNRQIIEDDEIDDQEWLKATWKNEVFEFLYDDSEDIYSLNDGTPVDGT